jgi:hypothetical protein
MDGETVHRFGRDDDFLVRAKEGQKATATATATATAKTEADPLRG